MTRKHYILIANFLNLAFPAITDYRDMTVERGAQIDGFRMAVEAVASAMALDNENFDKARFLEAVEGNA